MFDKLLASVPYNPSMVHQLAFYGKRMREESSVRRAGVIMLVLAFLIQFFAVISPPQPTVADSTNDLINGGITSAADAQKQCDDNVQHYRDIMYYYGINCVDLGHAAVITLKSTDTQAVAGHVDKLYSMGHLSYGATNPTTTKPTGEIRINPPGAIVYARYLDSFDTGPSSSYQALKFQAGKTGKTWYVLFNCGNLAIFGVPVPYAPPAPPAVPKPVAPAPTPPAPVSHPTPTPTTTPTPTPTPTPAPKPVCPNDSSILLSDTKNCFCVYNNTITAKDSACKPCSASVSSQDTLACLTLYKKAANVTANIADANNTTATAGDVITYTLYAKNNGKASIKQFVFEENISDTLDYATLTNAYGGTADANNLVTWPAVDIKPGATASQQITVTIQNPIAATPVSSSDGGHFDLTMTNVYGNAVNIHLPAPLVKAVEIQTTKLVNTGPGTSLFIGSLIVILAGYFYSRSRLLATESVIAVQENTSGGL
jgi:uncharacterized repeat protein (TIGR01451 family)